MWQRRSWNWFSRRMARRLLATAVRKDSVESLTKFSLPSPEFVSNNVKKKWQRELMMQIISEVKIFNDVFGEDAISISDDVYRELFNVSGWTARCEHLTSLQNSTKSSPAKDEKNFESSNSKTLRIMEKNRTLDAAGELVYARNFNTLYDIYGQDFRKKIDSAYGSRLLLSDTKSLFVDCRFLREMSVTTLTRYLQQMQALHDSNWFARRPFNMSFLHFQPDATISSLSKRYLRFLHGPSSGETSIPTHPLSPTLSTKRVSDVVGKDDLMYVSSQAKRFLPEKVPPNAKGFVICLTNDAHPSSSSLTAAIAASMVPYRIPIQRITGVCHSLSPIRQSKILNDYARGETINNAIIQNAELYSRQKKTTDDLFESKAKEFASLIEKVNRV